MYTVRVHVRVQCTTDLVTGIEETSCLVSGTMYVHVHIGPAHVCLFLFVCCKHICMYNVRVYVPTTDIVYTLLYIKNKQALLSILVAVE